MDFCLFFYSWYYKITNLSHSFFVWNIKTGKKLYSESLPVNYWKIIHYFISSGWKDSHHFKDQWQTSNNKRRALWQEDSFTAIIPKNHFISLYTIQGGKYQSTAIAEIKSNIAVSPPELLGQQIELCYLAPRAGRGSLVRALRKVTPTSPNPTSAPMHSYPDKEH